MNFGFAEQINFALEKLDMKEVIEIAETKLGQLPETEYHEVIGKSLVGQADELTRSMRSCKKLLRIILPVIWDRMREIGVNRSSLPDLWN